jgi:type VI protein secretion system component Hcp
MKRFTEKEEKTMRTSFHPMLMTMLLAGAGLSASAQSNMLVNIDGLCTFPALSWSMQETQPHPLSAGPAAKTTVTVSATKTVDICSPKIYKQVVTGNHVATVKFGPPMPAHPDMIGTPTLTLSNAFIVQTSLNDTASAGMPTETLSFTFDSFSTQESGASSAGQTHTTLSMPDISCTASVSAWSISAGNFPVTSTSAGGAGAGKPSLSALQVTKPLDACSQKTVQAITAATHLTKIVLTQVDAATGSTFTTTLTDAEITSYQVGGASNSGQPLEMIQISYSVITIEMRTSSADSQSGYDQKQQKPL